FADLDHRDYDAGDLRMFSERFRERQTALNICCRCGHDALIDRVFDDRAGDLKTAQYLYARFEHRREVIGDAGEEYFLVDVAHGRRVESRAREEYSSLLRPAVAIEEHKAYRHHDENEQDVLGHEFRDADDDLGIDRRLLAYLVEHVGKVRDDYCHHQRHDDDER